VTGFISIYVFAWLLEHVGSWLGGKGTFDDLFNFMIWLTQGGILLQVLILIGLMGSHGLLSTLWGVVQFGALIWVFIVYIIMLSAAHRFSILTAIGTMILSFVIVVIPVGLVLHILGVFLGHSLL
jgi:hypothetical protein